jgi:protein-S-isoprenylcysteine O-methyltransferase Ste14
MTVIIYKIAQITILGLFTAFISDRRQKPGMTPLVDQKATKFLKVSYLFPIAAYGYSLFRIQSLGTVDWLSLAFAAIATFLVVRGKLDLGAHHTWTGYYLKGGQRTRNGIYGFLPHPMYTGIILMISACSLVYLFRLPWYFTTAALVSCSYVVVFLVLAARREEKILNGVD